MCIRDRFIIQSFNPLSGKEPKIYQIIDSNMAELPNELDNRCLDLIEKLGKKEEGNFEMWDRESLLNSTMKNLLEDF